MNCARFWCSVVAVYATMGIIASLMTGSRYTAGMFALALLICVDEIADTWPNEDDA